MNIQHLEHFFSDFQIYRLRPGNIIRLVRYALGLSSREFAKKTGLSQTDITRFELGQKPIPEKKMWIFFEKLSVTCPIQFYSSYAITRDVFNKDKYGNPIPRPDKGEYSKLDLNTCLKESIFRENYVKLILSSNLYSNYQGNSFHGIEVLRKLLWRVLHEVIYNHNDSGFFDNEKVLSIITFLQGMISYDKLFDKVFLKKQIIPNKHDIINNLYNHIMHPNRPADNYIIWFVDLFMLMFYSFSIDFEERLVSVSLFEDIQPPKNLIMCWESGLVFNFQGPNNSCHQ